MGLRSTHRDNDQNESGDGNYDDNQVAVAECAGGKVGPRPVRPGSQLRQFSIAQAGNRILHPLRVGMSRLQRLLRLLRGEELLQGFEIVLPYTGGIHRRFLQIRGTHHVCRSLREEGLWNGKDRNQNTSRDGSKGLLGKMHLSQPPTRFWPDARILHVPGPNFSGYRTEYWVRVLRLDIKQIWSVRHHLRLQFLSPTDDNRIVTSTSFYQDPQAVSPFRPGALVIATLTNPREKFWGAILHLAGEGLSLRGVDVASFDDLASQIKSGEPFTSGVVFFPMHRVERMELDLPEGNLLSLAQRFAQKTGLDPAPLLVSEFLAGAGGEKKR